MGIIWYRNISNANEKKIEAIEHDIDKFTISEDSEGYFTFNTIISTLSFTEVTENDVGIYWCEVQVLAGDGAVKSFNPCYFTTLQPASQYPDSTVCPSIVFTLPEMACAFPYNSCHNQNVSAPSTMADEVPTSPTSIPSTSTTFTPSPQSSSLEDEESSIHIPLWIYPIIVVPSLIGICFTIANVAYVIRRYIERRNKVKNASVEKGKVSGKICALSHSHQFPRLWFIETFCRLYLHQTCTYYVV